VTAFDGRLRGENVAWRATAPPGQDEVKRAVPAFTPSRRGGPLRPAALLGVLLVVQAGAALGAEGDASQPEAERKAEASALLKRGAQLIDAEDLDGALAQFEAAYRLVPSPSILHNFGIVYQGLGRKAAALDAFQRFLEEAPRAPPAAREHAQRAVQTLLREVAALRVQADLDGATILVDGRKVGQTPRDKSIYLDPGPHQVSVEKADLGAVAAERFEVSASQQLTVPVHLARTRPPAPAAEVKQPAAFPGPAPSGGPGWQRPAAWASAAGAVLAAGLFATQMLVRHRRITEFNDRGCGTDDEKQGGEDCQSLLARGKTAEKWAAASGLAAGALGLGAAVLSFTLPETRAGHALSLRASLSGLGLGLQGRF
jgi:hypothetical protein